MSTTISTDRTTLAYSLSEEDGEDFSLFGLLVTIKISADETGGQYSLIEAAVPPGLG